MFLGDGTLEVFQWVGLVGAFVCAVGVRVSVAGNWKRLVGCVAGVFAFGVVAFGIRMSGLPVLIVKIPPGGGFEPKRGRSYFGERYTLQNGTTVSLEGDRDGTLIVNDSAKTMRIQTVYYGSISLPSNPTPVPAMGAFASGLRIDNVGPNDPPPSEVASNISFDMRNWLTW
ncbi:hypothetical protein BH09MYX1_BH09MYX1_38230 [soil metagenome]